MSKQEWKFRGKCKSTGNWVYGSLITMNDGVWIIPQSYDCVAISEKPDGSYLINGMIEIYRDSVGLWTGKKDKNGKEVYIGDVYAEIHGLYVIEWNKEKGMIEQQLISIEKHAYKPETVIGNTTDNPQLLEGK
jgi:hypothetical protein